jgi:transposase-like protein
MNTELEKENIISEYLTTEITYRALGEKSGVDFRTIHQWVRIFQGKVKYRKKDKKQELTVEESTEQLPTDINQLREELRKAKLHNKLLNAMIDIAEEQLKIDIRKKSGTKQ